MKAGIPKLSSIQCPYEDCSSRAESIQGSPESGEKVPSSIRLKGRYFRKEDSRWIRRYGCLRCQRTFSASRLTACFGQKKRRINVPIGRLLCSGVSQRRIARLLRVNLKTVERKLLFLAKQAHTSRLQWLELRKMNGQHFLALQFDEMESFERSKCLPLSIPLVVERGTRKILGFEVGRMPANGPLAEI